MGWSGPKTAAKWLNEYGTLDALLENQDRIEGKVGENLRSHSADVALSRAAAYARGHGGPRGEPYDEADARLASHLAPPRARGPVGHASPLGAHSDSLRAEFGYGRPA